MKKILSVVLPVLLLAGCKVDVETKVNTDDLQSVQHKLVAGNIRVEVPSCQDYEDSRKESRSLTELKEKMPAIFSNAEYKECYKEKLNSYASFVVPVGVGSVESGAQGVKAVNAEIYIVSNEDVLAGVFITPEAIKRLNAAKKSAIGDFSLAMTLVVEKGKQPIPKMAAIGAYMTGTVAKNTPLIMSGVMIEGQEIKLRLSDVSNSALENGSIAPVLVKAGLVEKLLSNLK